MVIATGTTQQSFTSANLGYSQVTGAPFAEPSALAGTTDHVIAADPYGYKYVAIAGIDNSNDDIDIALESVSATGVLSQVADLKEPTGSTELGSIAFSPSGNYLALSSAKTSSADGEVYLVAVNTSSSTPSLGPVVTNSYPSSGPASLAFSPRGGVLAVGLTSGEVQTLSVPSLTVSSSVSIPAVDGVTPQPVAIAFSTGGEFLATANGTSNTVSLIAVAQNAALTFQSTTAVSSTAIDPSALAFNPQGSVTSNISLAVANQGTPVPGGTPQNPSLSFYTVKIPASSGAASLSELAGSPIGLSSVPYGLVYAPSGRYLTIAEEGSTFTGLAVEGVTIAGGSITPVQTLADGLPTHGDTVAESSGSLLFAADTIAASSPSQAPSSGLVNDWSLGTRLTISAPAQATHGTPVTINSGVFPLLAVSPPGGVITFSSGSTTLCSSVVSGADTAVCTTSSLPVGTDDITATYPAQGGFGPSSASTTILITSPTTTSVSIPTTHTGEPWAGGELWYGLSGGLGVVGFMALKRGRRIALADRTK